MMESPGETHTKCVICWKALQKNKKNAEGEDKESAPSSSITYSSRDGRLLFRQFCKVFLSIGNLKSSASSVICSGCSRNVDRALDTKEKMKVVELRVQQLQLELLEEMKELKMYVRLLEWQLGKIERSVKKMTAEEHVKDHRDQQTDWNDVGGRNRRKGGRSRSRLSSGKWKSNARNTDHDDHFVRECIANVTSELRHFRNELLQKVSCRGEEETIIRPTRNRNPPEDEVDGAGAEEDKDIGGATDSIPEYLPPFSVSSHQPNSPCDNDDYSNGSEDIEESSSSNKPKQDIGKIKLEPALASALEVSNNVAIADNIEGCVEATAKDDDDEATYELCEKSGLRRLKGKGRAWIQIDHISEERLKEDFRIRKLYHRTNTRFYYCAKGRRRQSCPVQLKIRVLPNGVRTIFKNRYEHANHRSQPKGLTKEQRAFAEDCFVEKGIRKARDILELLRIQGIAEPRYKILENLVGRLRKKFKLTKPREKKKK